MKTRTMTGKTITIHCDCDHCRAAGPTVIHRNVLDGSMNEYLKYLLESAEIVVATFKRLDKGE